MMQLEGVVGFISLMALVVSQNLGSKLCNFLKTFVSINLYITTTNIKAYII